MKKKTKTEKKYNYWFYFNTGDYITVSHRLEDIFPTLYSGSAMCLNSGRFDVSFFCSPKQAREITKYIASNFKGKVVIERCDNV